jgi:hypothetical protein
MTPEMEACIISICEAIDHAVDVARKERGEV